MISDNNETIQNEKDKLLAEIRAEFSGETPEGFDEASGEGAAPEELTLPSDEELEESINSDPVITKVSKPLPNWATASNLFRSPSASPSSL